MQLSIYAQHSRNCNAFSVRKTSWTKINGKIEFHCVRERKQRFWKFQINEKSLLCVCNSGDCGGQVGSCLPFTSILYDFFASYNGKISIEELTSAHKWIDYPWLLSNDHLLYFAFCVTPASWMLFAIFGKLHEIAFPLNFADASALNKKCFWCGKFCWNYGNLQGFLQNGC